MYRANYVKLRNAAWHMTGDKDAAHDLVQEVFVRLWNKRDEIHLILNQPAYLLRAVMNSALTQIERRKREVKSVEDRHTSGQGTDDALMYRELETRVQRAIENLPPKCKAIFVLSRFEEKSYKEIAAILNLSVKTVENQMGIALKKMRDELQPFLNKEILIFLICGEIAAELIRYAQDLQ
jgi:RNA polymerase sigma-70 factor, ECF subfamily